jgi:hypothetical protein
VTKPTDVLSKTNGSEGANKEGKHQADLLLIFYVIHQSASSAPYNRVFVQSSYIKYIIETGIHHTSIRYSVTL